MSKKNEQNVLLKLRDVRKAKGMSLNALAQQVGIDYQRVGRMERGETQMTIDMLNRISQVLQVPLSQLINEDSIGIQNSITGALEDKDTEINLIPAIYEEVDAFCAKHQLIADNKVKVYLATVIFKGVQDIRTNLKDNEGLVKVLFQVLGAIFERLVLTEDSPARITE